VRPLYKLLVLSVFVSVITLAPADGQEQRSKPEQQTHNAENGPCLPPLPCGTTPSVVNRPTANDYYRATQQKSKSIWEKAFGPETWVTWALVAFAAGAMFVGLRTLSAIETQTKAITISANAASDTVRIMNDTAEKQLRAYVYPVAAIRHRDGIGAPYIKLEIKNAGQTPAYDCIRYAVEAISPTFPQLPENFETIPVDVRKFKSPIPPGESVEIVADAIPLNPDQLNQIRESRAAVYLFGKITYRTFGKDRESTFRLVCVGENIVRGLFAISEEGNAAD
jgi:hypothetical protein